MQAKSASLIGGGGRKKKGEPSFRIRLQRTVGNLLQDSLRNNGSVHTHTHECSWECGMSTGNFVSDEVSGCVFWGAWWIIRLAHCLPSPAGPRPCTPEELARVRSSPIFTTCQGKGVSGPYFYCTAMIFMCLHSISLDLTPVFVEIIEERPKFRPLKRLNIYRLAREVWIVKGNTPCAWSVSANMELKHNFLTENMFTTEVRTTLGRFERVTSSAVHSASVLENLLKSATPGCKSHLPATRTFFLQTSVPQCIYFYSINNIFASRWPSITRRIDLECRGVVWLGAFC